MNESLDALRKSVREAEAAVSSSTAGGEWWTASNAMTISTVTLAFGMLTLCLATYLLVRLGADSRAVLKVFGLILIVTMSAFLMVAGYSDEQLTPIIGLLGTLAGYLLGTESAPDRKRFQQPGAETEK